MNEQKFIRNTTQIYYNNLIVWKIRKNYLT